jgi:hypothetical protein
MEEVQWQEQPQVICPLYQLQEVFSQGRFSKLLLCAHLQAIQDFRTGISTVDPQV